MFWWWQLTFFADTVLHLPRLILLTPQLLFPSTSTPFPISSSSTSHVPSVVFSALSCNPFSVLNRDTPSSTPSTLNFTPCLLLLQLQTSLSVFYPFNLEFHSQPKLHSSLCSQMLFLSLSSKFTTALTSPQASLTSLPPFKVSIPCVSISVSPTKTVSDIAAYIAQFFTEAPVLPLPS